MFQPFALPRRPLTAARLCLPWVALCLAGCPADPVPHTEFPNDRDAAVDARPANPFEDRPNVAPPFDAEAWQGFAERWYDAHCTRWARCTGLPQAACVGGMPSMGFAATGLRAVGDAVVRGDVDFDAAAAEACLDEVRDGQSCDGSWSGGPSCARALRGRVPLDGPCAVSASCQTGAYCRMDAPCAGRCAPRRKQGEPCRISEGSRACSDGLVCAANRCARIPARGEACGQGVCGAGDVCLAGRCVAAEGGVGEGQPCAGSIWYRAPALVADTNLLGFGRACEAGLYCASTAGWTCAPGRALGEPCSSLNPCADALRCAGVCVAVVDPGEACDGGLCALGGCAAGRCRAQAPVGATCAREALCGPAMDCTDGVCESPEIWCGRRFEPPPCNAVEECTQTAPVAATCEPTGTCTYLPRIEGLRLSAPRIDDVPEAVELLRGWPGADGWLLGFDERGGWLSPAVDGAPHPVLPALRFERANDAASGRPVRGEHATLRFDGVAQDHLWRPTDDGCVWAPSVVQAASVELEWGRYPDRLDGVVIALVIPFGSDVQLAGEPIDALLDARGIYRSSVAWLLEVRWSIAEVEGVDPPPDDGADEAEPVDLCADAP